jgi:hypothetical protein
MEDAKYLREQAQFFEQMSRLNSDPAVAKDYGAQAVSCRAKAVELEDSEVSPSLGRN